MKNTLWSVAVLALLVGAGTTAWAQESSDDPPEILSSELTLKTVLESDRLEVNFVIVDTDKVTQVTIDGEEQTITPGDTVLITRTFQFSKDVTQVKVSAMDEKGHQRTVTYTVYRPGVDPAAVAEAKEPELGWFATYDARWEYDSNPSLGFSLPFGLQGLTDITPPEVPKDHRINLNAVGGVTYGRWTAYVGANKISYRRQDIKVDYNVSSWFIGGAVDFPLSDSKSFQLGGTLLDLNLGDHDYMQTVTLSPSLRFSADNGDDGTAVTQYTLDVTRKDFAKDDQKDSTVFTVKREYGSLDKAKQDSYRSVYGIGSYTDGTFGPINNEDVDISEYYYLSGDWDWKARWDAGWLLNVGLGIQWRSYTNDFGGLSDKRIDFPGRIETAFGYQIIPRLAVILGYAYTFNISDKSPYDRSITGIGVNGSF